MSGENSEANDPDGIPSQWLVNYAFHAKDALAMLSSLAFLILPMLLAMVGVDALFGIKDGVPAHDQVSNIRFYEFSAAFLVAGTASGLVGKYLWLIFMCRILNRSNVGPLVAYGIPRRIGRMDRAIIRRFYRTDDIPIEARLCPPKSACYISRICATTFTAGAIFAIAIGFLPIMRGDHRSWQCALMLAVLSLIFLAVGRLERRP